MKLVTFLKDGRSCLAVKTEQGVLDISAALAAGESKIANVPLSIMETIDRGAPALTALQKFAEHALSAEDAENYLLSEARMTYAPCVTDPGKIICIGLNYRKHAEETNSKVPEYPILFSKFNTTLSGNKQNIFVPKVASKVDYEAELAIVIGKRAKYVSKEDALNYVFGYCSANDLSARDLQFRSAQWLLGKSCDGFCPIGPYVVTADEVGDPNQLSIKCSVNGESRQNSNTADMIFKCNELVSYISHHMTLLPGDIILTGTPEGVILGYAEENRVWLKGGDVVTVEIEKLGSLQNRLVQEA